MDICKIEDCQTKAVAKGLCQKHYVRFKRHGDPLIVKPRNHGMSGTRIYDLWSNIKKNHTVCIRWLVFRNFFDDVGFRPGYEFWLQKIDKTKEFSPDNYKWVTRK